MNEFVHENQAVAAVLRDQFIILKVSYGDGNDNEEFLSNYPNVPAYPHFFVLESDGDVLHAQGTAELEEGRGYDEDVFLAFLKDWTPGNDGTVASVLLDDDFGKVMQSITDRQNEVRAFRFVYSETVHEFKSPFAEEFAAQVASATTEEERVVAEMKRDLHPSTDTRYEQQTLLAFDDDRVRVVIDGNRPSDHDPDRTIAPYKYLEVFDGLTSTLYFPADNPGVDGGFAEVYSGNMTDAVEYVSASPIILAYRGLDWIRSREQAGRLDVSAVRSDFIDDRECIVIGDNEGLSIWVDPARDHQVVREFMNYGERTSHQLDISYVSDERYGWAPGSWTRSTYWSDGSLKSSVETVAMEYALNPDLPTETFTLEIAPGTRVTDSRSAAPDGVSDD